MFSNAFTVLVSYLLCIGCFVSSSVSSVSVDASANLNQVIDSKPCTSHYCRPSFLIIGAGKSGTSSLYYYLHDHPQVEPARTKQVQFFDHQYKKGSLWYFKSNFPKQMEEGHITGESSPGYIVYSFVPSRVFSMLPLFKIIAILREPIDRIWSSYHYNYIDVLRARRNAVVGGLDSFVKAECDILEMCLERRGYDPRSGSVSAAPVDFVTDCFDPVKQNVHLKMIRKAHEASGRAGVVDFPQANPHLYRQFVSRGLYSLMLEHWYATFPASQIAVVCTESLSMLNEDAQEEGDKGRNTAADELLRVARFLGLQDFDFSATTAKGKFNAAHNKGYSKLTSWADAALSQTPQMPEELHQLLKDFYTPFNERLFELTNNHCNWPLNEETLHSQG